MLSYYLVPCVEKCCFLLKIIEDISTLQVPRVNILPGLQLWRPPLKIIQFYFYRFFIYYFLFFFSKLFYFNTCRNDAFREYKKHYQPKVEFPLSQHLVRKIFFLINKKKKKLQMTRKGTHYSDLCMQIKENEGPIANYLGCGDRTRVQTDTSSEQKGARIICQRQRFTVTFLLFRYVAGSKYPKGPVGPTNLSLFSSSHFQFLPQKKEKKEANFECITSYPAASVHLQNLRDSPYFHERCVTDTWRLRTPLLYGGASPAISGKNEPGPQVAGAKTNMLFHTDLKIHKNNK